MIVRQVLLKCAPTLASDAAKKRTHFLYVGCRHRAPAKRSCVSFHRIGIVHAHRFTRSFSLFLNFRKAFHSFMKVPDSSARTGREKYTRKRALGTWVDVFIRGKIGKVRRLCRVVSREYVNLLDYLLHGLTTSSFHYTIN